MKVLVKKPGKSPEIKSISDTLKSLQSEVDGYIEFVYIKDFHKKDIMVIVDDEGRLKGKSPNILLVDSKYSVLDCMCGNILFTGTKYTDDGPSCDSLSEDQISFLYEKIFNNSTKYSCSEGYVLDSVIIG